MKKALFIMMDTMVDKVYDEETQAEIHKHFDVIGKPLTKENCLENPDLLAEVEVIFSGWGLLLLTKNF